MDIPGLLSNQPQQNQLANLLRGVTGLLDTARPKAQNVLAGLLGGYADKYLGKPLNNLLGISPEGVAETKAMMNSPAVQMGMNLMPLGMIAYHGSPHTFDKFSLDKIGTGEGAQAYGHGLYLAQSPEVASTYAGRAATDISPRPDGTYRAMVLDKSSKPYAAQNFTDKDSALSWAREQQSKFGDSNLYKTDIPDEAVARFLDWDKSLAEQSPEVQAALKKMHPKNWDQITGMSGQDYLKYGLGVGGETTLRQQGIPGIRYLDGGSRGTGSGTSNFVAFSPDLIRILERNGVSTGAEPWKPGEWAGK